MLALEGLEIAVTLSALLVPLEVETTAPVGSSSFAAQEFAPGVLCLLFSHGRGSAIVLFDDGIDVVVDGVVGLVVGGHIVVDDGGQRGQGKLQGEGDVGKNGGGRAVTTERAVLVVEEVRDDALGVEGVAARQVSAAGIVEEGLEADGALFRHVRGRASARKFLRNGSSPVEV